MYRIYNSWKRTSLFYPVLILGIVCSLAANIFFYYVLTSHFIGFGDGWSRLNIARRIVDNLTPGIAQLGGVWLPFPQLLIVPFAAIDALYFRGIAGAFVNSPAYVASVVFMFLLIKNITGNKYAALIALLPYALNANLLYFQTTPMSEPLFLLGIVGAAYYFKRWYDSEKLLHIMFFGCFIMLASLTRYEGYMLVLIGVVVVIITLMHKKKSYAQVEGTTVLFLPLVFYGIFLWCLYSWVIFGDPLNWLQIYSGSRSVVSGIETQLEQTYVSGSSFLAKLVPQFKLLFDGGIVMSGLMFIPLMIFAIVHVAYGVYSRALRFCIDTILLLLILLAPMLFLYVTGLRSSPPMEFPPLHYVMTLFDTSYSFGHEYNVRYGISALPFFTVVVAILLHRYWSMIYIRYVLICVFIVQVVCSTIPSVTVLYNFPQRLASFKTEQDNSDKDAVRQVYDGGHILISALAHDAMMYRLHMPYATYIFEGTNKYWKHSVEKPHLYARFIITRNSDKPKSVLGNFDVVLYHLDIDQVKMHYDIVYESKNIIIRKIKPNYESGIIIDEVKKTGQF